MAKPLWKPSRRSQANLKEHIKERNKKSSGLRKACEHSSASANDTTSSRARLKSIQANNRALALALQEQKVKVREARDAFTLLKGENQCLKFQIFYLQALLQLQQVQGGFWFLIFPLKVPPLLCSCRHPHNSPVEVKQRAGSKCGQNWVSLLYSAASHLKPCSPGDYQSCFSCLITVKPFLLAECGNVSFSACNDSCCHCTRALCSSTAYCET
ncbi:uncharacterized protein FN964_001508 isoform 1-T1 [Alca torda]